MTLSAAQHEHELQMARDERLHHVVREAYKEMLRFVYPLQEKVSAIDPLTGSQGAAPTLYPDNEVRKLVARVSTVGSEEVMDALREIRSRFHRYPKLLL